MIITLDARKVQKDKLVKFIVALEAATGCSVEVKESYVLEVEDPKTAAILQSAFGGNGHQPIETGKKKKQKKRAEGDKTHERGKFVLKAMPA